MERIITKVKTVRHNWWEAFKQAIKLRGYEYYKGPKEIKFRYPAPGSVPQDMKSRPNLYKHDWKTPFKESTFDIRAKDVRTDIANQYQAYIEGKEHVLDPKNPQHFNVLQGPTYNRKLQKPPHIATDTIYDKYEPRQVTAKRYKECYEKDQENYAQFVDDFVPARGIGYDEVYNPSFMKHHPRGTSPILNERRLQDMFLELEWYLTDVVNKNRIESKQMDMYKGTVKKWQVLDDQAYSRDQIEKIQAAIKAPNPDELEAYAEENKRPMTLPITNENVSDWRDKKRAVDTADFNAKLIEFEKKREQNYFMKRYERPKQIQE